MSDSSADAHASPRRWWALAILVAAQFMFSVDTFVTNVSMISIGIDLKASPAQAEAMVAFFQVSYAATLVTAGRLGDIYKRKQVFLIGLASFSMSSLWCGLASFPIELVAARAMQGVSGAIMVPQVLAFIRTLFPDTERARAFSIFSVALGLGGISGLLLGGGLIHLDIWGLKWRVAFLMNAPIGAFLIASAIYILPSKQAAEQKSLDFGGAAILFGALTLLLGSLLFGRDFGWTWRIWACLILGLVAMIFFILFERKLKTLGGTPVLDISLLDSRELQLGVAASSTLYFGVTSFLFTFSIYLQGSLKLPALWAGMATAPLAVGFITSSLLVKRQIPSVRKRRMISGCIEMMIAVILIAALSLTLPDTTSGLSYLALALAYGFPLTLYGFGQGLVMVPLIDVVLAHTQSNSAGATSGLVVMLQQFAGALGVAIVGSIYFGIRSDISHGTGEMVAAMSAVVVAYLLTAGLLHWSLVVRS